MLHSFNYMLHICNDIKKGHLTMIGQSFLFYKHVSILRHLGCIIVANLGGHLLCDTSGGLLQYQYEPKTIVLV